MVQGQQLLLKAIFSAKDNSTPEDCWSAFICMIEIYDPRTYLPYIELCRDKYVCIKIIEDFCSDMLYIAFTLR
jgi:hypothetical protein